jgi:hypothetical protein
MTSPKDSESPISAQRAEAFVADLNSAGNEMITRASLKINEIQYRRAMQIGYMMACQDYGLEVPEFGNPAEGTGL